MEYKVSIIVPIYNVENYIHRCIQSLVLQTYENLEILLIDDGSPDQCGEIADEYATRDSRITVFHKKNGGLSDARNYGMRYATGEFILFVDSDDWLDHQMIEKMVNYSLKYKADVVQSAFYYAYDDHYLYDNRYFSKEDEPVVLNHHDLMAELVINEKVKNFAWGKLFRAELILDIPFEKGVLFEDVFWAHQVMERVKTYVILHEPLCYYYQRCGSIVSNYSTRNLDILKGLKMRHDFIQANYPELINESYKVILKTHLEHYLLLFLNRDKDPKAIHRKNIERYIEYNGSVLKKAVNHDRDLTKQLLFFQFHPLFFIGFKGGRKVLRKLKLLSEPVKLQRLDH